jgi:hypothetical protein
MIRIIKVALTLAATFSPILYSQKAPLAPNFRFLVERKTALPFSSKTGLLGPFQSAIGTGRGPIRWTQRIVLPADISSLSLHVQIASTGTSRWKLQFSVRGEIKDTIESDSPRALTGDAWTGQIDGNAVLVELIAEDEPVGLQCIIDKYDTPFQPTIPQGKFADMMESFSTQTNDIRLLGKPVARLRIKTDDGEIMCTGFLVADDLLVTNYHCISTSAEAANTLVDFGLDRAGVSPKTFRGCRLEVINSSLSYDYVVVRLINSPGRIYGHVMLTSYNRESFDGLQKTMLLIQHPGGGPKMISKVGCEMIRERIEGIELEVFSDFGHHCDTEGGSSGSPVFALDTHELVGLHHAGYDGDDKLGGANPTGPSPTSDTTLVNQAVYIGYILADIKSQSVKVYKEIVNNSQ